MNGPQQQQDTKTRQRNKRRMQQIKNIPKIYKPKQDKIEIYTKQSPRVAFIIFIIQLIKILWDHVIFVMRCDYILCAHTHTNKESEEGKSTTKQANSINLFTAD